MEKKSPLANDNCIAVDLVPLYPDSIKPKVLDTLREFYISTYQDKFFTAPPRWFRTYILMEAIYHVPASIAIIRGLLKGPYSIERVPPFSQLILANMCR